jgi:hypothetical protein
MVAQMGITNTLADINVTKRLYSFKCTTIS